MRILIVSPRARGIGGVAQHVSKLAEKLSELGHEVEVMSCENTPYLPVRGLANPSFIVTSSIKATLKKLRGSRYDVVHAHNVPSALAMRVIGGRRILTLHGVFSEQVEYLHGGIYGRIAGFLEDKALEWADVITAVSRKTAEHYRAVKRVDVKHVPNAIDLRDLPDEEERLYSPQVIFVGRLSAEKGVDVLIRAFRRLDLDAHLLIVGEGPEREKLEALASGDARIHFLGYKPRPEALKLLKGSDVFVLPSIHEGLSTALLEAMALGVPVVASRTGGNEELVEDGVTGILVPRNDPQALMRAIKTLLEDSELAKTLARKARLVVKSNYSWDVVIQRYVEIYQGLA